jgi:predicted esterase
MRALLCVLVLTVLALPLLAVNLGELLAKVQPDPQGVLINGLPYRLFVPKDYDAKQAYPLVLALHGAGERGVDNMRQGGNGLLVWAQPQVQEKHPCFVLLPQCPQAIDTFQLAKGYHHPCGLHELTDVDPKETAVKRIALPLGRFMRGDKQTFVILTEAGKKDVAPAFTLSHIRLGSKDDGPYVSFKGRTVTWLKEGFFMTPQGCYCTETPETLLAAAAPNCRVSDDGLSLSITSAPGINQRLGIEWPCTIAADTMFYADLQLHTAGYGQRIGFLQGERIPEYRWVNVDWSPKVPDAMPAEPSAAMRLVLDALAATQKAYHIDPARIYVTGLSMGGYGTWDIIARKPNLFAAAVPVCGGGDPATAPKIARVAVWAFHGGNDGVVPTVRSRLMIDALKAAGAAPRYTEYPGVGHDSWNKAYADPELVEWLFAQHR